jgi:hypothetical protein
MVDESTIKASDRADATGTEDVRQALAATFAPEPTA